LGDAISRQIYPVKATARGAQRPAPCPPRGTESQFEKPCSRLNWINLNKLKRCF